MRIRNIISLSGILCLILAGVVSCKRDSERMASYGWKLTGNTSDSLLERLDFCMYNYSDPDTISWLANEYCRRSQAEDPNNIYRHRRLYWEGTAQFLQGNYRKGDSLRRMALDNCDSVQFPHDYLVYRMSIEQSDDFTDNKFRYLRYASDLKSFIEYGDLASGFSRAVQLSQLMSETGMHGSALGYALMADSLLTETGLQKLRENNRVNIASCLYNSGDTVGAVRILKDLLSESAGRNIAIDAIIYFNIYNMNNDTDALLNSWRIVNNAPELRKMRPLVVAGMVKSGALNAEQLAYDEVVGMLEEASEYAYLPEEEMYIKEALCDVAVANEDWNKLPSAFTDYEASVDHHIRNQKKGEIIGAEVQIMINEIEAYAAKRHHNSIIIFLITLAAVITIGAVIVISLIVRLNKHRQIELLTQIEIEQQKRRLLSNTVISKDSSADTDDLHGETEVQEGDKDDTGTYNEQLFMTVFIKHYPHVSKSGRRLATHIWHGLDTIEIAKEMNIRKESVMQARWRLRKQMHLQPEEDLEVTILQILSTSIPKDSSGE